MNNTLDYAERVDLPSDIYFGNKTFTVSYVSIILPFVSYHTNVIMYNYTLGQYTWIGELWRRYNCI